MANKVLLLAVAAFADLFYVAISLFGRLFIKKQPDKVIPNQELWYILWLSTWGASRSEAKYFKKVMRNQAH